MLDIHKENAIVDFLQREDCRSSKEIRRHSKLQPSHLDSAEVGYRAAGRVRRSCKRTLSYSDAANENPLDRNSKFTWPL